MQEREILNELVVDIDCMIPLYEHYDPLNIFNVLELQRNEIRHSNMLYWLLNPHKQHGLGDKFIKRFLIEAVKSQKVRNLQPVDIDIMDLGKAIVYKEYPTDKQGRIDLLVVSKENNLVFAVENKIDTSDHDNQLARYKEYLEENYGVENMHLVLVYLTPNKDEPIDNKENWIPIGYQSIYEIVSKLIVNYQTNDKAEVYIKDYLELIKRDIMKEKDELKDLCEGIYFQHQEAFDIMYEYIKQIKDQDILADAIYDVLYKQQSEKDYKFHSRGPTGTMFFNFNKYDELTIRVDRYEKEWRIRVVISYGNPEDEKKKKAFECFKDKIKSNKVLGQGELQLCSKTFIKRKDDTQKIKMDKLKEEIKTKFDSWYEDTWRDITKQYEQA